MPSWPVTRGREVGVGIEQVERDGQIVDDRDGALLGIERLHRQADERMGTLGLEVGDHERFGS